MKLAQVVGKVVLSKAIPAFEGHLLHLTQDLDESLEPVGEVEVSATWQAMADGDRVLVEVARESCNAFEPPMPIDSVILGKVEEVHIEPAHRQKR